MTLNELSRFYWARMNQAASVEGAINRFKCDDEVNMWYCLLNWAYYMDIADEIAYATDIVDWSEANDALRGYFV